MEQPSPDDENIDYDDLVRKAVAGDAVALSVLLVLIQPRLRRLATRRLPLDIVRYVDPLDVVQDAMAIAFREIGSLRTPSFPGFIAWTNTICDNSIAMARRRYRAKKRGGTAEGDVAAVGDIDKLMAFLCQNTDSPRSVAGNREFIALIESAMEDLGTKYRTVISLRFIEGLDRKAAAHRMNCTEGSIRMLTLRALRHLRALLPMGSSTARASVG